MHHFSRSSTLILQEKRIIRVFLLLQMKRAGILIGLQKNSLLLITLPIRALTILNQSKPA